MNKYLRYLALLFALCLFLTACGGNKEDNRDVTPDEVVDVTPDSPRDETSGQTPAPAVPHNTQMLLSTADPLMDMTQMKREHYDNGTYYYMDIGGGNALRAINSCYQTSIKEDETEEEYAQRRAIGLSMTFAPGNPYNLTVGKSEELSEALGYPVYLVSFLTGSDLNAFCWTVYLTRTEHYSYQYAFATAPQTSVELEEKIMDYFGTLKLDTIPEA